MLSLVISESPLLNGIQIRLRFGCFAVFNIGHEAGDGHRREDTDNGDDDHEFDECETFAIL